MIEVVVYKHNERNDEVMKYTNKLIKNIVIGTLIFSAFAIAGFSVQAESTSYKISKSEQQKMTSMLYKHQLTMGRLSNYKDTDKLWLFSSLQHHGINNIPDASKPYQGKNYFYYTVHSKKDIDKLSKEMFRTVIKPKSNYFSSDSFLVAKFKQNKFHLIQPESGSAMVRYSIQPKINFRKLSKGLYYSSIDTYSLVLDNEHLDKLYPQTKKNPQYDWGKKTYLKNTRTTWNSLQKKLTPKESTGFIIMKMKYVKGKKEWQLLEIEKDHKPLSENDIKKRIKWYK